MRWYGKRFCTRRCNGSRTQILNGRFGFSLPGGFRAARFFVWRGEFAWVDCVSVYRESQGRRVKKVAGVVCLLAAFCLVVFGRMQNASDEKDARTYIRQAAEARDR
jgi:hypothetical protein